MRFNLAVMRYMYNCIMVLLIIYYALPIKNNIIKVKKLKLTYINKIFYTKYYPH